MSKGVNQLPIVAEISAEQLPKGSFGATSPTFPTLTAKHVVYVNSSQQLTGEEAFTYDETNNLLTVGTGTTNSGTRGYFVGTVNGIISAVAKNLSNGAAAFVGVYAANDGSDYAEMMCQSSGFSSTGSDPVVGANGAKFSGTANVQITAGNLGATGKSIFFTVGGTSSAELAATIDGSKNVVIGAAAIATNATDGFLYIPTCAGAPSGTPTAKTGRAPIVYDSTNNKLYVYNGAWKSVTLA